MKYFLLLQKNLYCLIVYNQQSFLLHIQELLKKGYDADNVLMVGDAPGDCDAAESNGVWYYPILVNQEKESWEELRLTALERLRSGTYAEIQDEKKRQFLQNLGG